MRRIKYALVLLVILMLINIILVSRVEAKLMERISTVENSVAYLDKAVEELKGQSVDNSLGVMINENKIEELQKDKPEPTPIPTPEPTPEPTPKPTATPKKESSKASAPKVQSTKETGSGWVSLGKHRLTAYCPCAKCCGRQTGITASGAKAVQGVTIGVDPKKIPYGTKVKINGHIYIAQDCGSGVSGKAIDIFFNSHSDAVRFGMQYAEVFVRG